jgi:hypothetical protein
VALKIFGTFFKVGSYTSSKQHFADLRNAAFRRVGRQTVVEHKSPFPMRRIIPGGNPPEVAAKFGKT